HWAIPRIIWKKMEEERMGKDVGRQGTLDGFVEKQAGSVVYTRENTLHAVTQFVAVDDQSLSIANKTMFRNCLVAMRPKSRLHDLPTTHDIVNHLHNEFVRWLAQLKEDIDV
ncbi:hypothetical protein K443DRAFT_36310, partial [Laccaria amethystina LaAM-08-1]